MKILGEVTHAVFLGALVTAFPSLQGSPGPGGIRSGDPFLPAEEAAMTSPDGQYALIRVPAPEGAVAVRHLLLHRGYVQWKRSLPFEQWDAVVTNAGEVIGHDVDCDDNVNLFVLDAEGSSVVDKIWPLKIGREQSLSYNLQVHDVFVHTGLRRAGWVVSSCEAGAAAQYQIWTAPLDGGKDWERFPAPRASSCGEARLCRLVDVVEIPGTAYYAAQWYFPTSPPSWAIAVLDASFSILWEKALIEDFESSDRDLSTTWSSSYGDRGSLFPSTEDQTFEVGSLREQARIQYRVEVSEAGQLEVKETGQSWPWVYTKESVVSHFDTRTKGLSTVGLSCSPAGCLGSLWRGFAHGSALLETDGDRERFRWIDLPDLEAICAFGEGEWLVAGASRVIAFDANTGQSSPIDALAGPIVSMVPSDSGAVVLYGWVLDDEEDAIGLAWVDTHGEVQQTVNVSELCDPLLWDPTSIAVRDDHAIILNQGHEMIFWSRAEGLVRSVRIRGSLDWSWIAVQGEDLAIANAEFIALVDPASGAMSDLYEVKGNTPLRELTADPATESLVVSQGNSLTVVKHTRFGFGARSLRTALSE